MAETLTILLTDFRDTDVVGQEIVVSLLGGDRAVPDPGPPTEAGRFVSSLPQSIWTDHNGQATIDLIPTTDLVGRFQYSANIPGVGVIPFTMPNNPASLYDLVGSAPLPARQLPDPNSTPDGDTVVSLNNAWQTARYIYIQNSTPPAPTAGVDALWVDTSVSPPTWSYWTGGGWNQFALQPNSVSTSAVQSEAITDGQLADGAAIERVIGSRAITRDKIGDNEILSRHFFPGSVDRDALAPGSVNYLILAPETVRDTELATNAATARVLADDSVDAGALQTGAVQADAVAAGAIGETALATNAATARVLADNSVDTAAVQNQAITGPKLAPGVIQGSHLGAGEVGSRELEDGAVVEPKLGAGAVSTRALAVDSVTQDRVADNAIGATQLDANAVAARNIQTGAVVADGLAAGAVLASKMADDSVQNRAIVDQAVDEQQIADDAISAVKMKGNSVQRAAIQAQAVDATKIAPGAVGESQLADDGISAAKLKSGAAVTRVIPDAAVVRSKLGSDVPLLPAGGTARQRLEKASGTDYDVRWADDPEAAAIANNSITTRQLALYTGPGPSAPFDGSEQAEFRHALGIVEARGFVRATFTLTPGTTNSLPGYVAAGLLVPATGTISPTDGIFSLDRDYDILALIFDVDELVVILDRAISPGTDAIFNIGGHALRVSQADASVTDDNYRLGAHRYEFHSLRSGLLATGTRTTFTVGGDVEQEAGRDAPNVASWALTSNQLAVPTGKLSPDTPTNGDALLYDGSVAVWAKVNSVNLADGAVGNSQLDGNAVAESNINAGAVTLSKLSAAVQARLNPMGGAGGQSGIDSLVQYVSLWKYAASTPPASELTGSPPTWGPDWRNIPSGWSALPPTSGTGNLYHAITTATLDEPSNTYTLGTWTILLADSFNEQYSPNPYSVPPTITANYTAASRYWRRRNADGSWPNLWQPLYAGLGSWTVLKSFSLASNTVPRVETFDVPLPARSVRFLGINVDVRFPSTGQTDLTVSRALPVWNALWPVAANDVTSTFVASALYVVKASPNGVLFNSTQASLDTIAAGSSSHAQIRFKFRGNTRTGEINDIRIIDQASSGQNAYMTLLYY